VHRLRRDPQAVYDYAERLRALGTEHKLALYTGVGSIIRGWALCYQNRPKVGLRELRGGIDAFAALKVRLNLAYFTAVLAEACHRSGELEPALAAVEDADRLAERWCQSGILQLKGEILISSGAARWADAETCFDEALRIARRQEAKSPELRTATSLARLWGEQGRRAEARKLLAPV